MTSSAPHSILPPLSADERRHSAEAAALIGEHIAAAGGWVPFDRFMELALYAPGLGYYSAGSVKIGGGGDFVTAPEVSGLFSRCVAQQCAQVLSAVGGQILEVGAGTGRMAVDVLQSLAQLGAVPERYAILEVSADLADRQRARIRELPEPLRERVVWLDRLPERPIRGVILANEVLDALPVKRFRMEAGVARELGVALAGESFVWRGASREAEVSQGADPVGPIASLAGGDMPVRGGEPAGAFGQAVSALLREIPLALPDGYVSEVCLRTEPWIAGVGDCLEQGALLLFDYGLPRAHFYHPQRAEGTLRCYFKQRAHDDPFINIAVQDITAWVDFTRVAEAALAAGLDVMGFATQAAFLLGNGIESLIAQATDTVEQIRLAAEARRLLLPGEMGESFKVMALGRNLEIPLSGFLHQDLRDSL